MSTPPEEIQEARRIEWDAEPVCPNELDPILCAEDENGLFVPEAGCPVHDVDEPVTEQPTDPCACGHLRLNHHRLCNGERGKFRCPCRHFKLWRKA